MWRCYATYEFELRQVVWRTKVFKRPTTRHRHRWVFECLVCARAYVGDAKLSAHNTFMLIYIYRSVANASAQHSNRTHYAESLRDNISAIEMNGSGKSVYFIWCAKWLGGACPQCINEFDYSLNVHKQVEAKEKAPLCGPASEESNRPKRNARHTSRSTNDAVWDKRTVDERSWVSCVRSVNDEFDVQLELELVY